MDLLTQRCIVSVKCMAVLRDLAAEQSWAVMMMMMMMMMMTMIMMMLLLLMMTMTKTTTTVALVVCDSS